MPELPEVEYAVRLARRAAAGKGIVDIRALHPSQRRALPDDVAATISGDVVRDVRRRGKHQLVQLASGRTLHVHFRMTGDWRVIGPADALPPYARVVLALDDGTRLVLDDSRALSSVTLHAAGIDPLPAMGPEATARDFSRTWLGEALAARRVPIKAALLDQRVVAGVGNIYAAEALWYARLDPRHAANTLDAVQLAAVVAGVRRALGKALRHPERYYGVGGVSDAVRFNVYDREGRRCRRCGATIVRLVQAGRSTYWCGGCQV